MAIDINNVQFRKFSEFAQSVNENTIVKAEPMLDPNGQVRTIVAKRTDSLGNIGRLNSMKNKNDDVRALFRATVAEMFGGEDHIPASVLSAMRMEDYGHGKPLTARRILVVKQAIDNVSNLMAQGKEIVKEHYDRRGATPEKLNAMVEMAIAECGGDRDASEVILKAMGERLFVKGDSSLRSFEDAQKAVKKLKANFDVIRASSKGSAVKLAAGKRFLASLGGKTMPNDLIASIFSEVEKVKSSDIAKLKPSSSEVSIQKAVSQMTRIIDTVLVKANIFSINKEDSPIGEDELHSFRNLIAELTVAKGGASSARNIFSALGSENAQKVLLTYSKITNGEINDDDLPEKMKEEVRDFTFTADQALNGLKKAAGRCLGNNGFIENTEIFEGELDYDNFDYTFVFNEMKAFTQLKVDRSRTKFLASVVNGNNANADAIRKLFSDRAGPAQKDYRTFWDNEAKKNINAMLNNTLINECDSMMKGKWDEVTFKKDLTRGFNFFLPGGEKLSTDFTIARDQIAKFVTNGSTPRYEGLSAKDKGKANLVMAFLSQRTIQAVEESNETLLDPHGNLQILNFGGHIGGAAERNFTVSFDEYGNFVLDMNATRECDMVEVSNDGDAVNDVLELGEGSKLDVKLTLKIGKDEFDAIAGLDFTSVDRTEAEKIAKDETIDNRMLAMQRSLPNEFRLDLTHISITPTYTPTIL